MSAKPRPKPKPAIQANFSRWGALPPPTFNIERTPKSGVSFRDSRLLMDFFAGHQRDQAERDQRMIAALFAGTLVITHPHTGQRQYADQYYAPSLTHLDIGTNEDGKPEHHLEGGWVRQPDDVSRLAGLALASEEQILEFQGLPPLPKLEAAPPAVQAPPQEYAQAA